MESDQDRSGRVRRHRSAPHFGGLSSGKSAASLATHLRRIQGISAIFRILITALALCAESLVLNGRSNSRMAAMIKSHPGLKPLDEVDSEMSELIAQEQRRQACARRPKPRERGGERAESGRVDAPSSL